MKSRLKQDQNYIRRCFELASRGKGLVSPNPLVGAVLVKNGKVIGKGYHKKYGGPHAEVNAINKSNVDVSGSTLYCNLEPCCHKNKQTPPCVPLIIQKKIKRVIISNIDPNHEVNGKAIKQLRDAGVEVLTGILEQEGKSVNKFYFKYAKEKIPYIAIKIAQSIDGKISLNKKKQTWLTGSESKKSVHRLRSEYDAVLVGAGTIKADNPLLTVRKVKGRNPYRIMIDGKLNIPINSKVIHCSDPQKTIILTSLSSSKRKEAQLNKKGVQIFRLRANEQDHISIKTIIKFLADYMLTSVLVEGGRDIFTQFLKSNQFDDIIILQSNDILGEGIGAFNTKKMSKIKLTSIKRSGDDIKLTYRKNFVD